MHCVTIFDLPTENPSKRQKDVRFGVHWQTLSCFSWEKTSRDRNHFGNIDHCGRVCAARTRGHSLLYILQALNQRNYSDVSARTFTMQALQADKSAVIGNSICFDNKLETHPPPPPFASFLPFWRPVVYHAKKFPMSQKDKWKATSSLWLHYLYMIVFCSCSGVFQNGDWSHWVWASAINRHIDWLIWKIIPVKALCPPLNFRREWVIIVCGGSPWL